MGFNLDDYEPVADRIERFWQDHPKGSIVTLLVAQDEKRFVVKAFVCKETTEVYWQGDKTNADATGYAEEVIGSTNVNRTSALENCETSAIGRALANLGYAVKSRPSREEMAKAQPPPRQRSGPQQRSPRQNRTTDTETAPVASEPAPDIEIVRWVAKQKLALVDQLGGDKAKAKTIWADVLATYDLKPDDLPLKDSLQFIESDLSIEVGKALEAGAQSVLVEAGLVEQT